MRIVTAGQMRLIDQRTIGEFGIPGTVLMERAGLAVAVRIKELFDRKKVIVLAGGGNNSGDGIVAARNLFNWGWNVRVFLLAKEDRLSQDCLLQYRSAKKLGMPVEFRTKISERDLHSALVVDAVLGTGLSKPVGPPLSDVITFLNKSEAGVLSVDIPSGISADTGEVMGEAVKADYTVTFGLPKAGHLLFPGAEYTGKLFVEDIGFPKELLASDALMDHIVEAADAAALIPERPASSHKGDYGHVLIVAGSTGKTGAAMMAAAACLRAGAGMVTLGVPETLADVFQSRATEEMVLPLPDGGEGTLSEDAAGVILGFLHDRADILAIGPGLTAGPAIKKLMKGILASAAAPMVIDADAINAIAEYPQLLESVKSPVVVTPHPGEMARLLGLKGQEKKYAGTDRIQVARDFSRRTGAYLVLKGAPTVVAAPEGRTFLNTTGNAGMATAGTGDVLTGVIAGLMGQGVAPLDAAILGVYLHGLSGDIAASARGMHSLIARDVIDNLSAAFVRLSAVVPGPR